MKKILNILLTIIIIFFTYGIISEITFQPLGKKELAILFPKYNEKIIRIFHKDLIGWSNKDYFDYFILQLDSVYLDSQYPIWNSEWEFVSFLNREVKEMTKWEKCPIDSVDYSKFIFEFNEISKLEDNLFQKEINNQNNYYCYIYVNNLEKYFLLYNPTENKLYYIRQKGF